MESNRNLSSIISKIRDEGPPGTEQEAPPAAHADKPAAHTGSEAVQVPATETDRRDTRKQLLRVFLPLALIAGLVLYVVSTNTGFRAALGLRTDTGSGNAQLHGPAGVDTAVNVAAVMVPASVDQQMVSDLLAKQLDMQARLEQLAGLLQQLSATLSRNQDEHAAALASLRREQQASIAALEASLAGLQRQQPEAVKRVSAPATGVAFKPESPAEPRAPVKRETIPQVQPKQLTPRPVKPQQEKVSEKSPQQAVLTQDKILPVKQEPAIPGEEWVVNVAASSSEQAMAALATKLKSKGVPVERQILTIDGDLMYRLRVPGFASSTEARSYARRIDSQYGLKGAWISRK